MVSLLYVLIWWETVPTSVWWKLHPVHTTILSLWYLLGHIQYLRHTVSIGNRLPWFCINFFQSPWFRCIIIESGILPWWVSRGWWWGCMFLKKGGLIHLSALCINFLMLFLSKTDMVLSINPCGNIFVFGE